ncbi:hypothetical protein [Variovorax ginsengisoli]|uniref:Transmembrane protein n=1 Tax=Variovorax ginsengisoli TaxID=363844 RepID=A0ABT9SDB6_9BURK|nr:hypothetical protein [Variovorax ginsengisoli]MDP9902346.1 hypothetical protein [Variovorax ginsengisoli]
MRTEASRRWWQGAFRLMLIWIAWMLVCAHLALVMAREAPSSDAKRVDSQRVNTMKEKTLNRPLELFN